MSEGFEEIVSSATPQVQALARNTRDLILDVKPDAVELAWPKQNISSYGVGPKKMSEHYCYIGMFKQHINLGFYYGADLPDPSGLLEGTGKLMRHIKISSQEQLEDPALRQIIEKAAGYLPKLAS